MTVALARAPAALARTTIARHSKSFALASTLLGARVRDETAIVYTWCRRADDAIDEAEAGEQTLALSWLSRELDEVYTGTPRDEVLAAFADVVRARAIPHHYPRELLAGMAMDVDGTRYETLDALVAYCWRVAGVVGLMMSHVFGVASDAALPRAAHLGIAMQLTNICRDVVEDWQRGRLYLPRDVLADNGAAWLPDTLGAPFPDAARVPVAGAVAELLAIADRYYRSADRGLRDLPWRAALAVRTARGVYSAIGCELAQRGFDVTRGRAVVSRPRKLAIAFAAIGRELVSAPRRIGRRPMHPPSTVLELDDLPAV
jgi:phytoene synthase